MRVVFISWWWPYPASNGSKIRIYNLLRHLAESHKVYLLSFAEPDEATLEQVAHLSEFCQHVEIVPKPTYQPDSFRSQIGYFSRWPRSLIDTYSETMAQHVRRWGAQADIIIGSQQQTLRYLELVPHVPALLEEIEVTGFHDRVRRAGGAGERLRAQMTVTKLENALRRLLQRGVAMTVVSAQEQEYLRTIAPNGAHIEVIPNGIDTQVYQPEGIPPVPNTLLYSGAVTYSANYDAVAFFVHDVLPLVRQRVPDICFTVTGSTGDVDVSALMAQPGVRFTGYLPEMAHTVQSSWAVVVPLREGGGTRLKILEALAMGTPVVSTPKGAEGLNVHPGTDILIADEPEAMADMICALLGDEALRTRLAQAGRQVVVKEYDAAIIGRRFVELIEAFVQQRTVIHG